MSYDKNAKNGETFRREENKQERNTNYERKEQKGAHGEHNKPKHGQSERREEKREERNEHFKRS